MSELRIDLGDIDLGEEEEEIDYENLVIDESKIHKEAYIDNIKDEKDLNIGFDPDEILKKREELKINLLYFDEKISKKSGDSYDYYKQFKVNVVGGFYASDEIDIFKMYLDKMQEQNNIPPYVVVTYEKHFEDIYNICKDYNFIKEIIIIHRNKKRFDDYLQKYKKLLKYIAKNYDDLVDYLKKMGDLTSNWNYFLRLFSSSRIFTSDEIQMDRQLSSCPIITAYEYDELYYIVHRAYAHFFTNVSGRKDPKFEKSPEFGDSNYNKIKEFLKQKNFDSSVYEELDTKFSGLKNAKDFTEKAIGYYTGEGYFCYTLNKVMREFEKGLIKLSYYMGPFLFGLNKYALEHPEKGLNEDTTLYRKLVVNPLDKYIYKLAVGHIICFPSLTSTSVLENSFHPTKKASQVNNNNNNNDSISLEMIIKYKHKEGNITPALNIEEFSQLKDEKERLIFPFTFFRVNSISEKQEKNSYVIDMEIINRKSIIEYDLKEGRRFNIEDLEETYDENEPLFIENGKEKTFKAKEEPQRQKSGGGCSIF